MHEAHSENYLAVTENVHINKEHIIDLSPMYKTQLKKHCSEVNDKGANKVMLC